MTEATTIPALTTESTARRKPVASRDEASGFRAADDVRQALLALGYNDKEAGLALKQVPAELPVSEAIRQALKLLSKG